MARLMQKRGEIMRVLLGAGQAAGQCLDHNVQAE